jgi:hypothetical protein
MTAKKFRDFQTWIRGQNRVSKSIPDWTKGRYFMIDGEVHGPFSNDEIPEEYQIILIDRSDLSCPE